VTPESTESRALARAVRVALAAALFALWLGHTGVARADDLQADTSSATTTEPAPATVATHSAWRGDASTADPAAPAAGAANALNTDATSNSLAESALAPADTTPAPVAGDDGATNPAVAPENPGTTTVNIDASPPPSTSGDKTDAAPPASGSGSEKELAAALRRAGKHEIVIATPTKAAVRPSKPAHESAPAKPSQKPITTVPSIVKPVVTDQHVDARTALPGQHRVEHTRTSAAGKAAAPVQQLPPAPDRQPGSPSAPLGFGAAMGAGSGNNVGGVGLAVVVALFLLTAPWGLRRLRLATSAPTDSLFARACARPG
jgi:hypothetical protein